VAENFWGAAAVSTNPNGGDTNGILSQLETSGPRGSYWVAFTAFPNLRSFTRCGCLAPSSSSGFLWLNAARTRPHPS